MSSFGKEMQACLHCRGKGQVTYHACTGPDYCNCESDKCTLCHGTGKITFKIARMYKIQNFISLSGVILTGIGVIAWPVMGIYLASYYGPIVDEGPSFHLNGRAALGMAGGAIIAFLVPFIGHKSVSLFKRLKSS